jgi:hypothetical protein
MVLTSLMISGVEHFVKCLLVIWIFISAYSCLFANLLLDCLFLLICSFSKRMYCKCVFPVCGLALNFLNGPFGEQKFLIIM